MKNGFSFFGTSFPAITPTMITDNFAPVTGLKGNYGTISSGISSGFVSALNTAVEGKVPAGDIALAAVHLRAAQAILNGSLVALSNGTY